MLTAVFHRIPLPLASVNNLRDLVYVGNLVDALITCATHPAAANITYLVSDGESVSTPGLLGQLALAMKVSSHLFPFPPTLIRLAGKLLGKSAQVDRLLGSLQVDSGRIRRELNWVPPYTLEHGLRATALSYQTRKAI
jgi:nucleoside-diphosphate-sugar epimerase